MMVERNPSFVNAKSEDGTSAVITAAYYHRNEIAQMLVSKGAELDIFEATAVGRLETVRNLVEKEEAIINSFSDDGFTPIHLASFFGHLNAVKFLIEKKANVNPIARNRTKVMPLHSAVAGNYAEICKLLVMNEAEVNARQQNDFTPLHGAAMNGNLEVVKLLLDHGAEINAKNDEGKSALSFSEMDGPESGPKEDRERVAEFLKQHGAK